MLFATFAAQVCMTLAGYEAVYLVWDLFSNGFSVADAQAAGTVLASVPWSWRLGITNRHQSRLLRFREHVVANDRLRGQSIVSSLNELARTLATSVGAIWHKRGALDGEPKMQDRRQLPRQTKCLRGRVYFNNGHKSLPCLIRDVAYEGARIVIADPAAIPNEIDLYIPKRKRITRASVRWRHGEKLGLALSDVGRQAWERPSRRAHGPR